MLSEHEILVFNGIKEKFEPRRDVVAMEKEANIYINNNFYMTFRYLPSQVKELVIGHLLTEGIIDDIKELLEVNLSKNNIYVRLSASNVLDRLRRLSSIIINDYGSVGQEFLRTAQKLKSSQVRFSVKSVFKAIEILNSRALIFKASGGTHAATLVNRYNEVIAFSEDVGRHNAVDKVIGEAAIKGFNFGEVLLALTGRLSSEVIIKAARVGIPILASISAPTSLGIKIAEGLGLTLIGFVRGNRFNIYTYPNRIEEWARLCNDSYKGC
jgi:FdhD protein